jgi:hypothetical protein
MFPVKAENNLTRQDLSEIVAQTFRTILWQLEIVLFIY